MFQAMRKLTTLIFLLLGLLSAIQAQNNALNFDGVDDFVNCGNPTAFQSNKITMEAWIKAKPASGYRGIVTKQGAYSLYLSNNILISHLYNVTDLSTGINVADDTWHHVALTLSGGMVTVYLDGVARANYSGYIVNDQTKNLLIGEGAPDYGQAFNGSIDGVRIWNVARTQAQIQSTMNSNTPSGTGLLAAYYFNQGSANNDNSGVTTLTDATGNNRNGTLYNFALSGTSSNWSTGATALPVKLSFFQALTQEKSIQLQWITANETNNQGFEVLHSTDAYVWQVLGFVEGHGTITEPSSYTFQHLNPSPLGNYYRLRQVDFDGKAEFSKVIFAFAEGSGNKPYVFPTLTNGLVKIESAGKKLDEVLVLNSNGQIVLRNNASTQIDLSNWSAGVYWVQLISGRNKVMQRVLKQ